MITSEENIKKICNVLNNKNRPLKERFRALFTLKNIGGPIAINGIKQCFQDDSALLKHELAYCLGQMQDVTALPILNKILEDKTQEPMVRHEAAEALGAIGSLESLPILEKYAQDPVIEVAETCNIAVDRIRWLYRKDKEDLSANPYMSVDPAPSSSVQSIETLKSILLDETAPLFERYRAMFSLRNDGSKEAIEALGAGLKLGKSALFKHEVAFVMGQLQDSNSIPFLKESLANREENEMVRHECAEALGAIATSDCLDILNDYLKDEKRVVKESCEIALDMCEYENSPEFQYANTLVEITS